MFFSYYFFCFLGVAADLRFHVCMKDLYFSQFFRPITNSHIFTIVRGNSENNQIEDVITIITQTCCCVY